MWDDCKDNLTSDQKESVTKLLNQVEHLFSKGKTDIGKRIINDNLYRKVHDPITGNLFQLVLPQSLH